MFFERFEINLHHSGAFEFFGAFACSLECFSVHPAEGTKNWVQETREKCLGEYFYKIKEGDKINPRTYFDQNGDNH